MNKDEAIMMCRTLEQNEAVQLALKVREGERQIELLEKIVKEFELDKPEKKDIKLKEV